MATRTVAPQDLVTLGTGILAAVGVPPADARLLADSLVTAELWGHSSHGMLRLPWYAARLRSGAMEPVTRPTVVTDSGPLVVLDGNDGIGQVLTARAVDLGIERARAHGIAGSRSATPITSARPPTSPAARRRPAAWPCWRRTPARRWRRGVAARRRSARTRGRSPHRAAVRPVVMDIANTAVARGKIYLAKERGEPIPEGWAADADGVPTTDAREAVHGVILPMAGHKGYAITFMMDVLAGVLTGSSFGTGVAGPYDPERRSGCGHF